MYAQIILPDLHFYVFVSITYLYRVNFLIGSSTDSAMAQKVESKTNKRNNRKRMIEKDDSANRNIKYCHFEITWPSNSARQ